MTFCRRASCMAVLAGLVWFVPMATAQTQTPPPKQVEGFSQGFEPIENLPPTEQIPAARLVIPAYSIVWLGFFFYVMSLARRLGTVQREMARLEMDLKQSKRG